MIYIALEDLYMGDHVAVMERPNKIGKCNDPAEAGYLGVLRKIVQEGNEVEAVHITSLEEAMNASIKHGTIPAEIEIRTVKGVNDGGDHH